MVTGTQKGFVKLIYKKELKGPKLLGVTVVGARAGELIQEWVYVMTGKISLADVASIIHVYPTFSMANQKAAGEVLAETYLKGWTKRIVHLLMKLGR